MHKVLPCKSKKVTSSAPGKSATNLGKGLHIRIFVLRPAIRGLHIGIFVLRTRIRYLILKEIRRKKHEYKNIHAHLNGSCLLFRFLILLQACFIFN